MIIFILGNLLKKIYEDMQTKLNTPANLTQKIMVYSAVSYKR